MKRHPRGESPTETHPRPLLTRANWTSLNGEWRFSLEEKTFDRTIRVPFSPETAASGIEHRGFIRRCWYQRNFDRPAIKKEVDRVILHFGAVDYSTRVWVNDHLVAEHEGGYTPFAVDITAALSPSGAQVLTVCADDDPHDLAKPRGKQDWHEQPHSIWYPRTTGIWQTVWYEIVPRIHIAEVQWQPDLASSAMNFLARVDGEVPAPNLRLHVRLRFGDRLLVDDSYQVGGHELQRSISLAPSAIEDFNFDFLWSPEHPNLINAELELRDEKNNQIDRVNSYCAMRDIAVEGDQVLLNRRPVQLRLLLDQGYWKETGLTPPDDRAIQHDIELIKSMGFNGVRKHQKIEDPRFLYWADRMGLFVWEECPSAYQFSELAMMRLTRTWLEVLKRDRSHPCVICWVPFNESWGVPDLATSQRQRDAVRALYHLTKSIDPTRPCIGNDGWEAVVGDLITVHDYERDPQKLLARFESRDIEKLAREHRFGGRALVAPGGMLKDLPLVLSEFGGIGFSPEAGAWGYTFAKSAEDLSEQFTKLMDAVRAIPMFAGFCYTQFTDTYQEANGLLTMDRKAKIPIEEIRAAVLGRAAER